MLTVAYMKKNNKTFWPSRFPFLCGWWW